VVSDTRVAILTSFGPASSGKLVLLHTFLGKYLPVDSLNVDVYTCGEGGLARGIGVHLSYDSGFSNFSQHVQRYKTVFSYLAVCDSGELVPILADKILRNHLHLHHAMLVDVLPRETVMSGHARLQAKLQEIYLFRSARIFKFFVSNAGIAVAKSATREFERRTFFNAFTSVDLKKSLSASGILDCIETDMISATPLRIHPASFPAPPGLPKLSHGGHKVGKFTCSKCFERNCLTICVSEGDNQINLAGAGISAYCSLLGRGKERKFLSGYVLDVISQSELTSLELVVGSSDKIILRAFRAQMSSAIRTRGVNFHLRVVTVLLQEDFGLYETWDFLIDKFTSGQYLTNWNVDDRKHRLALSSKINILNQDPSLDVVSSAVWTSYTPNLDWQGCLQRELDSAPSKCEIWYDFVGAYSLSTLFSSDATNAGLVGSMNYPHNSPLYRKSLHDRYSYFASEWRLSHPSPSHHAPACLDWSFWVNVAAKGGKFYHLDFPHEVYFLRTDSAERRDQESTDTCVESVLRGVRSHGLYNNACFWGFDFHSQHKWQRNIIAFMPGTIPTWFETLRQWLSTNNHQVTVYMPDKLSRVNEGKNEKLSVSYLDQFDLAVFGCSERPTDCTALHTYAVSLRALGVPLLGISSSQGAQSTMCGAYLCDGNIIWGENKQKYNSSNLSPLIFWLSGQKL